MADGDYKRLLDWAGRVGIEPEVEQMLAGAWSIKVAITSPVVFLAQATEETIDASAAKVIELIQTAAGGPLSDEIS